MKPDKAELILFKYSHLRIPFLIGIILLYNFAFSQEYFNNLEESPLSGNWIGTQTIDSGYAYSGSFFSKTDSIASYGLGIEDSFPDLMKGKNLFMEVSGYVKSNIPNNNAIYVITLVEPDGKSSYWKGIYLSGVLTDTTNWHYFTETIKIPANQSKSSKIKAYLWNQNKNSETLIDDLRFKFIPIENPTYIPDISFTSDQENMEMVFGNQFYSIFSNKNGKVVVVGNNNQKIIEDIRYYSERRFKSDTLSEYLNLRYRNSKTVGDQTLMNFSIKDKWGKLIIQMVCDNLSRKIQFNIKEKYRKRQDVIRESLVIKYGLPAYEVYRQNRKVDSDDLQNEYWLDNQGILFKDDDNSMAIYHNTHISSLQLADTQKSLFVNLDYELDHPFFRFPLAPDSTDWRVDESYSSYKNDKREYSFNIFINPSIPTLPRFMKNPAGMEAAYIWTEHADYTDIRTNRAVYFGSEKVTDADSSVGGFVYYDIPVTKSVFYDNPDSVTNSYASNGEFKDIESAILTDSDYSDYLFQINEKGHDICLHTPDHYTTTPELLEEALSFMQKNFGSPSWIDHGNNNGPENNREDLICDGTLEGSPLFALDLWNKYGVKYVHNAYYEELNTFGDWQFESSLEKPYGGFGDIFPKPDYYKHKTLTGDLYHWSTSSALFIDQEYLWNYMFNDDKLNRMVDNWYIEINHVYPAWVDPKKGMWTYDSDSTIVAHPGLNMALSNLCRLRDEGRLNITTIADHLDYRTAIDNVSYEIMNDGRVIVTNNNDSKISDLSMAALAKAVSVDGFIPEYKTIGADIVFWFDLEPGKSKLIRVVQ